MVARWVARPSAAPGLRMRNLGHWLFIGLWLFSLACRDRALAGPNAPVLPSSFIVNQPAEKVKGLTLVAPPEPFHQDPIPALKTVGANWIAAVPYAYTRPGRARVHFPDGVGQWWGEGRAGVRQTLRLAHAAGVHVMVKPQVYVPGGWTGGLDFQSPDEWQAWEADYRRYILSFAALAAEEHAELFCIGTEFRQVLRKRPAFWTALIAEIRAVYAGKLTYSANWDDWEQVPFWSQLDYIGLGAYYPLVNEPTPSVAALTAAWQPIVQKLAAYANQHKRPVLFTEFGYLSVDGSGWRNWELESAISSRPINQEAQANCLSALLSTWLPQPFWAGGFLWKWFPNMRGHEGYPERDYTPQGKLGETVLRRHYLGR